MDVEGEGERWLPAVWLGQLRIRVCCHFLRWGMDRKEKAGGRGRWGGSRDGEFSFEHTEVEKPGTHPDVL